MIIINADDWGRSKAETDAAYACFRNGRITSVTAMVFMADSERAAELAKESNLDFGLHLNLSQKYNGKFPASVANAHERVVRFLTQSKYAVFIYHPALRSAFRDVYEYQLEELIRLYGKPPSHVDGHQHRHLCANILFDSIIPRGQKVRRNFSFWPGEKSLLNRTYRRCVDRWLRRRYQLTDFFFSLGMALKMGTLGRITELAAGANVELMTHPVYPDEYSWLMGDGFLNLSARARTSSFSGLSPINTITNLQNS